MSGALAVHEEAANAPVLRLLVDDVSCSIRLLAIDRRRNIAAYDVLLANDADVEVSCRLYQLDKNRGTATLGLLDVGRRSIGRTRISFSAARKQGDCVFVKIAGDGIEKLGELQLPFVRRFPLGKVLGSLAGIALIALAGVQAWLTIGPPRITLVMPDSVRPGPVSVTYALSGISSATYVVTDADNTILGEGNLPLPAGAITVPLPPRNVSRDVRTIVDANGLFGHDTRSAVTNVVPIVTDPVPTFAQIVSLSAHREVDGETTIVLASYKADADRGTLHVVGADGKTLVTAPFSRLGKTRLVLPGPGVPTSAALRTVLTVARGKSRAIASVEVSRGDSQSGREPLPSDPFAFEAQVVGGQTFDVTIRRHLPAMQLDLQDDAGITLQEHEVPEGTASVTFLAPLVFKGTVYDVVCIYGSSDFSQTSIARPLRVLPN